jgi:integrase
MTSTFLRYYLKKKIFVAAKRQCEERLSLNTRGQKRLFHNPKTGLPWVNDQTIRERVWISAIKASGVIYRNPYQTQHTFASMMLSSGKNSLWVAQQMGHKDWDIIRKTYGRRLET